LGVFTLPDSPAAGRKVSRLPSSLDGPALPLGSLPAGQSLAPAVWLSPHRRCHVLSALLCAAAPLSIWCRRAAGGQKAPRGSRGTTGGTVGQAPPSLLLNIRAKIMYEQKTRGGAGDIFVFRFVAAGDDDTPPTEARSPSLISLDGRPSCWPTGGASRPIHSDLSLW